MKAILLKIFSELDARLEREASEGDGLCVVPPLRIVGQMALLLSDLPLPIHSTMDIDVLGISEGGFSKQLETELLKIGLCLEPDHRLIWMPPRSLYHPFYTGKHVKVEIADPLYIMASKCRFKREKDRRLLSDYFALFPGSREKVEEMEIDTTWIARHI